MSLSIKTFARALAVVAALAAPATMLVPGAANAQVSLGISVNIVPPALPVYVQPALPGPGYLWVPGYWAWDSGATDYYWVPGYWSQPPQVGVLWTPGYWGWNDGAYLFHGGYWGPTVGFYGGISYGFGYNGAGFFGGHWGPGGGYQYNRSVTNVTNVTNISTTNIYNQPVTNSNPSHTSFNGGTGGTTATPTPAQQAAADEKHIEPTAAQTQHEKAAQALPGSHFSANHGKPAVAAVAKPGEFKGPGVVRAKGAGAPAPKPAASGAAKPEAAPAKPEAAPDKPAPEKAKRAPEKARPEPEKARPEPARPAPAEHPAAGPRPAPRPAPHPGPRPAPKCEKPNCR